MLIWYTNFFFKILFFVFWEIANETYNEKFGIHHNTVAYKNINWLFFLCKITTMSSQYKFTTIRPYNFFTPIKTPEQLLQYKNIIQILNYNFDNSLF